MALHAFAAEMAALAYRIHEPRAGEIRLQWWREALQSGDAWGNPLAEALISTVRSCGLPLSALERLLDAHAADFYADPPANFSTFAGYAADTEGVALQLGALILGGKGEESGEAAGHAAVALALTRRLLRVEHDLRRGRLFLPADRLAVHGIAPKSLEAGRPATAALAAVAAEFRDVAMQRAGLAEAALKQLPPALVPAFLPLAIVAPTLRRPRSGHPGVDPGPLPQWRLQWALWRAARRWSH